MILTVQIETENHMQSGDSYVSNLVQGILKAELAKKKYKLGEVTICHVFQQGPLETAAWNFAREIREAASEAVNERIHEWASTPTSIKGIDLDCRQFDLDDNPVALAEELSLAELKALHEALGQHYYKLRCQSGTCSHSFYALAGAEDFNEKERLAREICGS